MIFLCYEQGMSAWGDEPWENWQWPTVDDDDMALEGEVLPYILESGNEVNPFRGQWQDWFYG